MGKYLSAKLKLTNNLHFRSETSTDFSLFVAIDCEMDQSECTSVVCKVSVIDENGGILLDTLVNPEAPITRSIYLKIMDESEPQEAKRADKYLS